MRYNSLFFCNKWKEILQEREIREVNHFWHTVEGIINSFLFTLIGLELFILDLSVSLILGGIFAFLILHASRFAANYLSFAFFPNFRNRSYNGSLAILSSLSGLPGFSAWINLRIMARMAVEEHSPPSLVPTWLEKKYFNS